MEYMMSSPGAGTDLASAYSQPSDVLASTLPSEQKVEPIQYSAEIPPSSASNNSPNTMIHQKVSPIEPVSDKQIYDQSELLQDINQKGLKSQMEILRKEMHDQQNANRLQYKESYERNSVYDKYVKRRKDISRFICLALIIIFAISTHDIVSKLLIEYIDSINISPTRAIGMRLTYPIGIVILYWTMKAFKL